MDVLNIWMLAIVIFVTAAVFEYAILLRILYFSNAAAAESTDCNLLEMDGADLKRLTRCRVGYYNAIESTA